MKAFARTFASIAAAVSLAVAGPATAAPAHRAKAKVAVRKPVASSAAIIPLPLNPIVPASQRVCANRAPSGLGFTMLRAGSGASPGESDTVLVNYIGYLAATGAVFDQNTRTPLQVGGVIQGFAQGLQMLGKTGVIRLCIPAQLGYGARASGPIPANSDLVFQVELIDFRSAAEIEKMRAAQGADTPPEPARQP